MATIDPATGLPRRRGRPKKVPLVTAGAYNGKSLDEILAMSDQQVQIAFDEIQVEASPFHWEPGDDQLNRAAWAGYGLCHSAEVVPIAQLQESSRAIHNANLRMELLRACVTKWVDSLEDGQLVAEVERLSETKFSVSQIRYSKRSDLQQQVSELTWPTLVQSSKLYVPPINPLEGGR